MEVMIFGARGSHCVSGQDFVKYGGLTTCVAIKTKKFWIIFDAGMGLVEAGRRIVADPDGITDIFIFLSHLHNDHIEGINFFPPLYMGNFNIHISGFGESSQVLLERISTTFSPPYFPLALGELKSQLETTVIGEDEVIVFDDEEGSWILRNVFRDPFAKGNFSVSNWYHPSHPRDGVLLFKLNYEGKVVIFATDVELYGNGQDRRCERLCAGADVVIMDATYTDEQYFNPDYVVQGYGHSYHSAVMGLAERVGVKKLRFHHHDPSATDAQLDEVDAKLKAINPEWGVAYAGETIEL